jgi:hypothetical protein
MNRFDSQYKLRVNDNIGDPSVLNSRFQDVDKRIGSLEDVDKTWEAAVDKLNKAGSAQVSAALGPVYAKISAFASLNTVFSARSSTEIALGEGERTFIIDEEDRAYFAPAAYIAGFVDGDLSRAWLGKPKSYDSSTGTLVVDVGRFTGVGQGANWVIHAASATDNASAALQAQQAAATATAAADSTVAAAATISDKTNLALAAAEDAVTAKQQVATDAANVASIKSDVQTMRDQVSADYKSFNERYLGPKSFDPVATNSGGALSNGLLYFNTTVGEMRTYKAAVGGWVAAYIAAPDSPVASVFGRSGPVGAADGDYNAAQIIVDPSAHITSTRVSAALEEIAAQLTDKVAAATTLAGYGITDAYTKEEANNAITAAVADKANAATTLAGYGIADSYTKAEVDAALVNLAAKATTLAGYGIVDAYTKEEVTNAITAAVAGKANAATTLAGYGIADSYTRTQIDGQFNDFASSVNTALAAKATKATTLAGYGIGDAYTKTQVDSALGGKQAALGFTPVNKAGDTISGDLTVYRTAAPNTGVVFLGNTGHYVYFDGTQYVMPGADLLVNGNKAWHAGNDAELTGWTLVGSVAMPGISASIANIPTKWKDLRIVILGLKSTAKINSGFSLKIGANNTPQATVINREYRITTTSISKDFLISFDHSPGGVGHADADVMSSAGVPEMGEYTFKALTGPINYIQWDIYTGDADSMTAGTMYVYGRR